MATLKTIAPATWNNTTENTSSYNFNLLSRFNQFADGQKQNHTLWFFVILVVHGVLILPLPAVLLYYFDAPIGVLAITMVCFFSNLIATMGGAGIRTALAFFAGSVLIHLIMILAFTL